MEDYSSDESTPHESDSNLIGFDTYDEWGFVPDTFDEGEAVYDETFLEEIMREESQKSIKEECPGTRERRLLTRDDDIPEHLKKFVAPDSFDGYAGIDLADLEDDAQNMSSEKGVDFFDEKRKDL